MKERSYDDSKGLSDAALLQHIIPPSDAEEHVSVATRNKRYRKSISVSSEDEEMAEFRKGALSDGTCVMENANDGSPSIDQIAHLIEPTTVNLMGEEVKVNTPLKKSRFKKDRQYLIATMNLGFECKVILDFDLNLNQCSQLCPLTERMKEDGMFAGSLREASDDTSILICKKK